MKKLSFLIVAAVLASACSKFSFDVAKRKYRPGYSVSVSVDKKSKPVAAVFRAAVRESTAVNAAPLLPAYPFLADATEQTENSMMPVKAREPRIINKARLANATPTPQSAKAKNAEMQKKIPSQQQKPKNGNRAFLLLGGLAAIISGAMLRLKVNRARKISHWAKNNKKKTWLAFVGIHAVLIPGALLTGMLLFANDFIITPVATGVLATAFIASCLLYPVKGALGKLFSNTYLRHKTTDLVVALSGFMLLAGAGNQMVSVPESRPAKLYASAARIFTSDSDKASPQFIIEKFALAGSHEKDSKKASSTAGKILLLLLAIVIFAILETLLMVLSCSIACSGQEGAAAAVFILGTAGLIVLLVLAIKDIFKKP